MIKKICLYSNGGKRYNIFPTCLVTPQDDGVIVALKWWTYHFGVYFLTKKVYNHG